MIHRMQHVIEDGKLPQTHFSLSREIAAACAALFNKQRKYVLDAAQKTTFVFANGMEQRLKILQ